MISMTFLGLEIPNFFQVFKDHENNLMLRELIKLKM